MRVSKTLVRQKLKYIITDVERIRALLQKNSPESFASDPVDSALAERYFERIINRAVDINFHLLRAAAQAPPDDYTQSFRDLAKIKALSPSLAHHLALAAGARNILVHEYDELDQTQFYSSLKDTVRLFPQYIKAVEQYIKK